MADYYLDYRGNDYNGGGYDASISGATVNLASGQYAALTASGLECVAGTTEITSVHGGFTTDMIGNTINIYNGYDFTYNHYFISGVPDANTILVDTTPATGGVDAASGVGKVGGAWRSHVNITTNPGGGGMDWTGKRYVVAGDIVHIKGNGEQNPASGQYLTYAWTRLFGGSYVNPVIYRGYNGRPSFDIIPNNLRFHESSALRFENIKCFGGDGSWERSLAQVNGNIQFDNCIFDQYGSRARAFQGSNIQNCYIYNSKQDETLTNATSHAILYVNSYANIIQNNVIENCVGTAITLGAAFAEGNVIHNIIGNGIDQLDLGTHTNQVRYNTINRCTGTGIIHSRQGRNTAIGNLVTNCSGVAIAETDLNYQDFELSKQDMDYNVLYNNTVNYSGYVGGNNDIIITANPYVNEASGDLNLNNDDGGKQCKAAVSIPIAGYGRGRNYHDAGALQSYEK